MTDGRFEPVLDDDADHDQVRRLVLSSGKVYYDIVGHDERASDPRSPSPGSSSSTPSRSQAAASLVASYPALEEVVWAQEEPQNMGAWRAIRHRLEEAIGGRVPLRYVGRPWRASPSEGYPTAHLQEQERIVRKFWRLGLGPSERRGAVRAASRTRRASG